MGQHGLSNLLAIAGLEKYVDEPPPDNMAREFDFAYMAAISLALEDMYGSRGGRGMALRVGRAAFAMGYKQFGVMRGLGDPAFRALPMRRRVIYGLKALASVYTNFTDQAASVEKSDNSYLFSVQNSPMAYQRTADKPVCHAQVGIIQEALRWASNGYEFYVRETGCAACGSDVCTFRINQTAIGDTSSLG